jgi:MarR family transcriptional regulator, organic hydroperoxide resistance regulator
MTEVDAGLQIEDWQLLARFSQAYRSLSDAFMDRIEMHRAQASLICRLYHHDGQSQSELAKQLGVQGPTATDMLQRMEEAGLVARRRDAANNRLVRVYLTDAGRDRERVITEQYLKVEDAVFAGFSEAEKNQFRQMLRRMLENMDVCKAAGQET